MLRFTFFLIFLTTSAFAQRFATPADSKVPETCTAVTDVGYPTPVEGDWTARDFHFKSGERLPEVRIHYCTIGTPQPAGGKVRNAVLLLHGTGGSGRQFL